MVSVRPRVWAVPLFTPRAGAEAEAVSQRVEFSSPALRAVVQIFMLQAAALRVVRLREPRVEMERRRQLAQCVEEAAEAEHQTPGQEREGGAAMADYPAAGLAEGVRQLLVRED